MLVLYTTPLSANGRKVLAVSRHLELDVDVRLVNVYRGEGRTPEYLAINPSGKIPTLIEGDFSLYESNAIMQYLCEAHGGFRLWSRDSKKRGLIARWLFWECAHWQPTLTTILSQCVGHRLLPDVVPPPAKDPEWDASVIRQLLTVLDSTFAASRFLAGHDVTIADFAVAGMVTYFPVAKFPFDKHPQFWDWYSRIEALDAWRATRETLWSVDCRDSPMEHRTP